MGRDSFIRAYAGRDHCRNGWIASLALLRTPSVMTRADEGREVLCGLRIETGFYGPPYFKPRFWFRCVSDASEIASRLASIPDLPGEETKT